VKICEWVNSFPLVKSCSRRSDASCVMPQIKSRAPINNAAAPIENSHQEESRLVICTGRCWFNNDPAGPANCPSLSLYAIVACTLYFRAYYADVRIGRVKSSPAIGTPISTSMKSRIRNPISFVIINITNLRLSESVTQKKWFCWSI